MPAFRPAVRALLRTPGVTALAVVSLALAIGANSAAFAVLNALVLRPIAVPNPGELVSFSVIGPDSADDPRPPAEAFAAIAAETSLFRSTLAWQGDYPMVNLEANGLRYASTLARVSGDYFATLGIRPLLGRFFDRSERGPVAVIDYRCWQHRYGRDPAIIGKTIRVDGVVRTIIGVTAERFTGMELEVAPEVTVPMDVTPPHLAVVARRRPGVSIEAVRARLDALWSALPATDRRRRIRVQPFATGFSFLRDRHVPALRLLLALAGSVLLIACLNLANLMLARAAARRHELFIRIALGASRARIARVLLAEALLLAAAGGALGLLFAAYAGHWLVDRLWTGLIATAIDPSPDARVVAFTAAISLAAGAFFGLAPVRGAFRFGVVPKTGRTRSTAAVLVTAQIALSVAVASFALLLVRTLHEVRTADLGFRRDHLLMVRLFPQSPDPIPNRAVYYRELAEALAHLPGVESVSYSAMGPVATADFRRPIASTEASLEYTGPGFFGAMGIRLLAGREFSWSDDERAPRVAIVSEGLAARLFPGESAAGRSVVFEGRPLTIAGVVAGASLWSARTHNPPAIYLPLMQESRANGFWIDVRAAGDPAALAAPVRRVLDGMGRHIALSAQTLDARLDAVLARERMTAGLAAFLGGLAVLLAAVGIYALMSQAVARRTREIGIRMALGAAPAAITRLMVRDTGKLLAAGLAVAVPVALWTSSPACLAATSAVVALAALAAAWRPARRAARIDPIQAIRAE